MNSLSYPLSNIYRGQPLRPLDMKGSTDIISGAQEAGGNGQFTNVNVRFRVTPSQ